MIVFRILGAIYGQALPNFSPLPALLLCSLVFLRGRMAWILPAAVLTAWLISSPIVSMLQGFNPFASLAPIVTAFVALLIIGLLVLPLRKRPAAPLVLAAGILAAVLFHLITGVAAWFADPRYLKTATGLYQALWSGLPSDVLPSWAFLRNLTAANLLFTGLFLAARHSWAPQRLAEQKVISPTIR